MMTGGKFLFFFFFFGFVSIENRLGALGIEIFRFQEHTEMTPTLKQDVSAVSHDVHG